MTNKPIKVLIADDSTVMRTLLLHLLRSDPQLEVIGAVEDGQAALDYVLQGRERPDVVLMDIHMPRMDGFEATRRIMEERALPIVICTATADPKELQVAFRAMEAGAVACVEKPLSPEHPDFDRHSANLLQTLRLMSEVKVVRRWARTNAGPHLVSNRNSVGASASANTSPSTGHGNATLPRMRSLNAPIVGIGASTGGPLVLQTILSQLPKDFAAPIVIVQHIAPGFLGGLVDWLNQTTGLTVQVAAHGVLLEASRVYIAPDDFHLSIQGRRIVLSREPAENGVRPAVSFMFRSLVATAGPATIGVLLTGMGKDGAVELKQLRDHGAWTIAQDRETSVVHGMPGEAIQLDAAVQVLPAGNIANSLVARVGRRAAAAGETAP